MELVNLSFQHNGLEGKALMNLTKEKLVCQDVIKEVQELQNLENKPIDVQMSVNLEPAKL
jgi:hypothetical protein